MALLLISVVPESIAAHCCAVVRLAKFAGSALMSQFLPDVTDITSMDSRSTSVTSELSGMEEISQFGAAL